MTEQALSTMLHSALEPSPAVAAIRDNAVKVMREQSSRELNTKRIRGEALLAYHAEISHGEWRSWVAEQNELHHATQGRDGFDVGIGSCEDYILLAKLYQNYFEVYESCKQRGAAYLYSLSAWLDSGKALEAFVFYRDRTALDSGIDSAFPALLNRFETGTLHEQEAVRIVQKAYESGDDRIVAVVQRYGLLNSRCVDTLVDIRASQQRAESDGEFRPDFFAPLFNSEGMVDFGKDEQIHIADLSHRELWDAYRLSCKMESPATTESVLSVELTHEQALELVKRYGDEDAQYIVEKDGTETIYKTKVTKPI